MIDSNFTWTKWHIHKQEDICKIKDSFCKDTLSHRYILLKVSHDRMENTRNISSLARKINIIFAETQVSAKGVEVWLNLKYMNRQFPLKRNVLGYIWLTTLY